MKSEKLALGGAMAAAFGAALCCIGPVLFALLGLGAFSAASVFQSLRPYLLAVAVLALAFGFYRVYFRREECAPGAACATKPVSKVNRAALWVALFVVTAFALSPYYIGYIATAVARQQQTAPGASAQSGLLETVTVAVEGMTCESCEVPIKAALDKTPGVRSAEVSFKQGTARIQYDPAQTNLDKIKSAVNSTGYKAK
ncbi:MAG: cation transporter [Acidobacteria bacterium]|nr:cation transporter [Acidobacteriota bacterium]